ncbi:MAG TPA: Hsp33 family molecular chaperone HslO, partial [Chroococcales cyanobacterium]
MPDSMIRATAGGGRIRAVVAITTQMAEEARRRHHTFPTATAALGKALTGGLLLSSVCQKDGGKMTIRIIGGGPIGGIVVDACHDGTVRGYV